MRDAALKQNVDEVRSWLAKGASPDARISGGPSALDSVLDMLVSPPGQGRWQRGDPPFVILFLMTRAMRHRDDKVVELTGALKPELGENPGAVALTMKGYTLTDSAGKSHPVAIASDETKFSNVEHSQFQFPVDFKTQYTISGVIVKGVLEADEIRAPIAPQRTGSEPTEGIVVPLGPMLPSTIDLVLPVVKKTRANSHPN